MALPDAKKKGRTNDKKLHEKTDRTQIETAVMRQTAKNRMRKIRGEKPKVATLIRSFSLEHDDLDEPKGSPTRECSRCGKTFDQDFSEDQNAYSSWRLCPECRKKKAQKKGKKSHVDEDETAVATLPYDPYPWQREAEEAFENHRFVVLACGNRSGKDRMTNMVGIRYFVECLAENRQVLHPDIVPSVLWWILAPTERMAKQNWRELKQFFPKPWVVAVSDSTMTMETIGGGIIEVRSGYDPNMLVGVGLDLCTITEAARFSDLALAWANIEARLNSPGRGREKDRIGHGAGQGKAIMNSSPWGRNDFYDMFMRGQKESMDYSSLWWSAKYPWTCNPNNAKLAAEIVHTKYGDLTYEETLKRQIGERAFRSNYLADFVAEDVAVFKNFEENCVISIYDEEQTGARTDAERKRFIQNWQKPVPGETYCGGYDPATGSSGDTPAFVIRHKETGRIVRAFDLYGKTYEEQFDFISNICKLYNYADLFFLRTGHTAVEHQFEKRGIREIPIDEQGQKKAQLVQTLELAVESRAIQVLYDGSEVIQTLIAQMNDYSEKKGKYKNNKTPHDDFVSALYAAFSEFTTGKFPIFYCPIMEMGDYGR